MEVGRMPMRLRHLVPLLLLCLSVVPATAEETRLDSSAIAALMQATALDDVFSQFGAGIAAQARLNEISSDRVFMAHWRTTAKTVLDAETLTRRLSAAMAGRIDLGEEAELNRFFVSQLGRRISTLERDMARLAPLEQDDAIALGHGLDSVAASARLALFDRLMALNSLEISRAMVCQSVRAMLLGLALTHQRPPIELPWGDIDAQVAAMQPSLVSELGAAQRALMAYAYRSLSDAELETYVAFLERPAARHFYAEAAFAVNQIVSTVMREFGETLAARMASVSI
jgi:hypothetical protein